MIRRKKKRRKKRERPSLRLTPYAWAKLKFLREVGPTEIGGFAVSAVDDPLLIEDIRLVRQTCSWASVEFDDAAVADFYDEQVDAERRPDQFARIWVHTHPGESPTPSGTDEATFARVFGRCDWAVMFILAEGDHTYARLRVQTGDSGAVAVTSLMEVSVAWDGLFPASDPVGWRAEYDACVSEALPVQETPALEDLWGDPWNRNAWPEAWPDSSPENRPENCNDAWYDGWDSAWDDETRYTLSDDFRDERLLTEGGAHVSPF